MHITYMLNLAEDNSDTIVIHKKLDDEYTREQCNLDDVKGLLEIKEGPDNVAWVTYLHRELSKVELTDARLCKLCFDNDEQQDWDAERSHG